MRIPVSTPRQSETERTPAAAAPAFKAGDHVQHPQFGEGIVVSCEPDRNDQVVTVAFKGGAGVKRLLLSFAPMEKISG